MNARGAKAQSSLGNLLALAACWNNSPAIRPAFTEAVNKTTSIRSLPFPEKRGNTIVAEIYTNLDIPTAQNGIVISMSCLK